MQWDDENIAIWLDRFDDLNYPVSIYHELVVEGKELAAKFSILGAWKTGSLRKEVYGEAYKDQSGNQYGFTHRWKSVNPVGYEVWQYITRNQEFFRAQIPGLFTDEEPDLVKDLCNKTGFGFVWAVFVLHCFYPKLYPLYDQHVYRAYCSITSDGKILPEAAAQKWSEYNKYRDFFIEKLNSIGLPYWELDRALWAFGKSIKQTRKSKEKKPMNKSIKPLSTAWCQDFTLGGKSKEFRWRFDSDNSLSILRKFKGNNVKRIAFEELVAIQDYVQKSDWTDLANSVSKLGDKTEKEGLGKFLHEELGWDITDAQLASQLAALFTHAGIWNSNNKKRGIKVKGQSNNWYDDLKAFYVKCYQSE